MRDVNRVVLQGILADAPRARSFEDGTRLVNLNVKTVTLEREDDGSTRERPAWHQVAVGGPKNAEIAEGLANGSSVYVEGELRTRRYTNPDGHEIYFTDVRANLVRPVAKSGHINRSLVLGNIARMDELRRFAWGQVLNFTVATSAGWTRQDGGRNEVTEWHRIVAFGKLAEELAEGLRKGQRALVEGRVRSRSYTDRNGVQRRATETQAQMVFVSAPRVETASWSSGSRADSGLGEQVDRQRGADDGRGWSGPAKGRDTAASGVDTSEDEDIVPF